VSSILKKAGPFKVEVTRTFMSKAVTIYFGCEDIPDGRHLSWVDEHANRLAKEIAKLLKEIK
jgi:hypothetical protein